jgi:hypothetical protein
VTAISVLASIYLQAVIAAGMEEVELFLAPLTARSKVREVLRGLVATRQVHTISLGHAPLFYVAGTLPEFAVAPTVYASSSMPASAYFLRFNDHEEELPEPAVAKQSLPDAAAPHKPTEVHAPRAAATRKPAASGKSAAARPHFSRPATLSRDRKPAQSSSSRPARRATADSRPAGARPSGARSASAARWSPKAATGANGKRNSAHAGSASGNGKPSNGNGRPATRPANGASSTRSTNSPTPAWGQRKIHSNGSKPAGKPAVSSRSVSAARGNSRKPALAAGAKAGNSKRYGFTARPKQGTKKRG